MHATVSPGDPCSSFHKQLELRRFGSAKKPAAYITQPWQQQHSQAHPASCLNCASSAASARASACASLRALCRLRCSDRSVLASCGGGGAGGKGT